MFSLDFPLSRFSYLKGTLSLDHFVSQLFPLVMTAYAGPILSVESWVILLPAHERPALPDAWPTGEQHPAGHGSGAPELPKFRTPVFRSEIPKICVDVCSILHRFFIF